MVQPEKPQSTNAKARKFCALRLVLISLLSLLACGCGLSQWVHNGFKVGPEYCHPPAAAVAEDWIDSNDERIIPAPPQFPDWWSVFDDPVLDHLIETAYAQNLSLSEAGWRVMQARASGQSLRAISFLSRNRDSQRTTAFWKARAWHCHHLCGHSTNGRPA